MQKANGHKLPGMDLPIGCRTAFGDFVVFRMHITLCRRAGRWCGLGDFVQEPGARVPPQRGIRVIGRSQLHRALVILHGLIDPALDGLNAAAMLQICPAPTLVDDALIVSLLVRALNVTERFFGGFVCMRHIFRKLIGQRQQQMDPRLLIVRVDGNNVAADTFGLGRFVQQAVMVGSFQARAMLSFEMGSGSGMMVLRASGRWVRILFGPHQFIQNHSYGIVVPVKLGDFVQELAGVHATWDPGHRPEPLHGELVILHGLIDPALDGLNAAAMLRICPAPTLVDDALVVSLLVRALDVTERFFGGFVCMRHIFRKLIGQRQQQMDPRLLIVRVDGNNVAADTFGLGRFVQQAVMVGSFGERGLCCLLRWEVDQA